MTYQTKVMTAYVLALFMTIIDGTMVNVALPTMAADFGMATTDIEWVAVGYLLSFAAVIPAAAWMGDRYGTKRTFLTSLILFVVASLLCGLAQNFEQLVAFRILQGLGAGLINPVGSTMLYRAFPLHERAKAAIGVLSVAVTAPAIGPMLGGAIVDSFSWHWIFLINGPIGVVAAVVSVKWLQETKLADTGRLDVAGLLLSAFGVGALLYTLSIGPEQGWLSPASLTFGAAGVTALVALVAVELRIEQPLLALRLFRDHLFRTVNIASTMVYAGFFGMIFVLPLYLQNLRGYSAFESGMAQSPQAIGIFLVSNLAGKRLYQAIGPRRLMTVGSALTAALTCCYALTGMTTPLSTIAGLSLLRGLAVGLVFVSLQTAAYATTTMEDTGQATSLFNTIRQVSYAAGVAIAATVMSAVIGHDESVASQLSGYRWGFLSVGLVMVPAVFVSWRVRDEDVAVTRGL